MSQIHAPSKEVPEQRITAMCEEAFRAKPARTFVKIGVAAHIPGDPENAPAYLDEHFYLTDNEIVEICRGFIEVLKPFTKHRSDREGRPIVRGAYRPAQGDSDGPRIGRPTR